MKRASIRNSILAMTLALAAAALPGCVPVMATGAGVGVLMAEDRRTPGTYLLDEEIELKTASTLRHAALSGAHVNATSYNRRVLLTGEIPNEDIRAKITALVKELPNVKTVLNETVVEGSSTLLGRTNDFYITTKVKGRLLDDKRFNGNHVKVITEASTVFLMGILKRQEAAAVAEVAAKTSGVGRVVKAFEYLD